MLTVMSNISECDISNTVNVFSETVVTLDKSIWLFDDQQAMRINMK